MAAQSKLIKNAVRKTKEWKEFRKHLIEKQKVSFISGKKLTKGANCHHLDLHLENYGVFDDDHQVMLNRKDHELIHRNFIKEYLSCNMILV